MLKKNSNWVIDLANSKVQSILFWYIRKLSVLSVSHDIECNLTLKNNKICSYTTYQHIANHFSWFFSNIILFKTTYLQFLAPCGSRSTGSEGTVLSPNYPKNYSVGHNCVYSITVPKEFGK